jgi:DnaK suppressor protein
MQSAEKASHQERFHKMLLMERGKVEARIREELADKVTKGQNSVLGPALDLGDISTWALERDVDYELLTMHTKALKDIDEALERLDEGTYGICVDCGKQISEKRLEAVSFTLYCLECQREKERLKETDNAMPWMERFAQMVQNQADGDESL